MNAQRRLAATEQLVERAARIRRDADETEQVKRRLREDVDARRRRLDELLTTAFAPTRSDARQVARLGYFNAEFWRKSDQAARLDALLEVALAAAHAERGNIQLSETGGGLRIAAQHGFSPAFLRYFAVVQDAGTACGLAYAEARPVAVADVAHSTVFTQPDTVTTMLNADVSAVISVPMCGPGGHLVGVLSVHYPRPNRIDESHRRILSLLSASAAHRLTAPQDG